MVNYILVLIYIVGMLYFFENIFWILVEFLEGMIFLYRR